MQPRNCLCIAFDPSQERLPNTIIFILYTQSVTTEAMLVEKLCVLVICVQLTLPMKQRSKIYRKCSQCSNCLCIALSCPGHMSVVYTQSVHKLKESILLQNHFLDSYTILIYIVLTKQPKHIVSMYRAANSVRVFRHSLRVQRS